MDGDTDGSTAVSWRPSAVRAAPVSAVVPLVAPTLGGSGGAAATVGLVLAEAILLYVGYGALTRVAGPAARELLGST